MNKEIMNHEFIFQKLKPGGCQSFSKNISNLVKGRDILNLEISILYLLANEMEIYLNVFGASVVKWISCKGNCTMVVTPDYRRRKKRYTEVFK